MKLQFWSSWELNKKRREKSLRRLKSKIRQERKIVRRNLRNRRKKNFDDLKFLIYQLCWMLYSIYLWWITDKYEAIFMEGVKAKKAALFTWYQLKNYLIFLLISILMSSNVHIKEKAERYMGCRNCKDDIYD